MASAKGQRTAALSNANLLMQNQGQTFSFLNDTTRSGLEALGQGVDSAKSDLKDYLPQSLGSLQTGYDTGVGALNSGYDAASQDVRSGIAGLSPYVTSGADANALYSDSLGLNGAEGNARATGAFQAGPGYQWQVDQATDAAARKANALGIGASGNTLTALSTLGSNLANQEYGGWQTRLQGLGAQGLTAAGQQLGGDQTLASLDSGRGTALAALAGNLGSGQSSLYSGTGAAEASLDASRGQQVLGAYQGLGNSVSALNQNTANQITNGFTQAGQASDAARNANDNLALGLLGQGIKLGTANLGGAGGSSIFGGLGKSLFG